MVACHSFLVRIRVWWPVTHSRSGYRYGGLAFTLASLLQSLPRSLFLRPFHQHLLAAGWLHRRADRNALLDTSILLHASDAICAYPFLSPTSAHTHTNSRLSHPGEDKISSFQTSSHLFRRLHVFLILGVSAWRLNGHWDMRTIIPFCAPDVSIRALHFRCIYWHDQHSSALSTRAIVLVCISDVSVGTITLFPHSRCNQVRS